MKWEGGRDEVETLEAEGFGRTTDGGKHNIIWRQSKYVSCARARVGCVCLGRYRAQPTRCKRQFAGTSGLRLGGPPEATYST